MSVLAFTFCANKTTIQSAEPNKVLSERQIAFFESKVRPILVNNCYECHSAEAGQAEGGLELDTADGMLRGGTTGPAIVAGNPNRSLLILSVRHQAPAKAMPPEDAADKLSDGDIAVLERWIRDGAPDPRKSKRADSRKETDQLYDSLNSWWAYQKVLPIQVPTADLAWSPLPIDQFIREKQIASGIKPVADAAPEFLLRRVCFDLTGLPPTNTQSEQFLDRIKNNGLDAAFATLVDELLESDQFGMHWGRHWLDVARYAESSGREVNLNYPHAWRYRNWVIEAINADMPYDKFLKYQIAGDLMPAKNTKQAASQIIATGFLAVGSRSLNEMNPQQFAVDQADEQIDTVFQATMGLTMACARCHDHKFDPISQRDYTSVAGIFLSTKTHYGTIGRGGMTRNASTLIQLPNTVGIEVLKRDSSKDSIEEQKSTLEQLKQEQLALRREVAIKLRNSEARDQAKVRELQAMNAAIQRLEAQLAEYDEEGDVVPVAMGVEDFPVRSNQPRFIAAARANRNRQVFDSISDSPFYARGEISLAGEEVPRAVPKLFGESAKYDIPQDSSGRLQLADWIASKENPMTARVAVNRVWGWIFGDALVNSVDNFGTTGTLPSHPELLDYLAHQLTTNGWSQKALIREIVLSRTYRLASQYDAANSLIDPDNEQFWRANRKRLPAESIRDAILQASMSLDTSLQLGSEIAAAGDGVVRINTGDEMRRPGRARQRYFARSNAETESNARSIFLAFPRGDANPFFDLFDAPDATMVQGQRDVTNVPSQSLFLMNSPLVHEHTLKLAKQIMKPEPSDQSSVIEALFLAILNRVPTEKEISLAEKMLQELRGDKTEGVASLAKSLFATAEFRFVD